MKRIILIGLGILVLASALAFIPRNTNTTGEGEGEHINWVTIEEAEELSLTTPKKVLVDMYTDWCGWCKKMDRDTYENPEVVAYINEHFYAVKFDAEQKEDVTLGGRTFAFRADQGRRGVHELAVSMMDGKMSYPTTVFFDEKLQRIAPLPGYQGAADMFAILNFMETEVYKTSPDLGGYIQKFKAERTQE